MGFYDRDYQRDYYGQQRGFNLAAPSTLTTKLAIVMFAVYVVQLLTRSPNGDGWLTELFSLHPNVLRYPWRVYELLTYGFLHDVRDLRHIVYNMLGLWFFGRAVEYRYGAREYLAFFLTAIIAAGCVWVGGELAANRHIVDFPAMLGASGGVTAVLILFALNFPHQTVLFMFFIPMPMWVLALLLVAMDAFGAVNRAGNVAFTAHLGGALFAFLYFQAGWRLEPLLPTTRLLQRLKRKPRLRVVDPDTSDDSEDDEDESREAQVDAILQKIQEHGRDSLTRKERRILEEASREYQRRRK